MLQIVTFEASHLTGITLHPKQAHWQYLVDQGMVPGAMTALDDGEVVAIGGVVESMGEIAGWLLFTDRFRPRHMLAVFRACRHAMMALRADGVQVAADVAADYAAAARLASMLGLSPLRPVVIEGRQMMRMIA